MPNSIPQPSPATPSVNANNPPAPTRQRLGALNGQRVSFDPSQTTVGMKHAALARDRAAYEQLHAASPDEYPLDEVGGGDEHLAGAVQPQHCVTATGGRRSRM